ncbi:hypothetical protein [Lutimonas vermicola]|uniref:Uncharacterized protein n=1 Tax=Lutimonas vermicola TaxID=414288 RepID=A0ABU9KZ52_9FLAO
MKNYQNFKPLLVAILAVLFFVAGSQDMFAQNKKNRIRINVDYFKVNDQEHYLNIKASARIDKQTVEVANAELDIMAIVDDEEIELGKAVTSAAGTTKYVIKDFKSLEPDSTGFYNLLVSFGGNDVFKKASKEISFKNADIRAQLITKDSVNYIAAHIIDTKMDSTIADVPLTVQVKRLFRPLKIGEDFYITDEEGAIEVAIEDGIPGLDGNLTLEVVLKDSDDYGTVSTAIIAPIGKNIVRESTFNERTMWSPRGKTPIFLLSLTFSFIIIVWGIFVYLFRNLMKIVKS